MVHFKQLTGIIFALIFLFEQTFYAYGTPCFASDYGVSVQCLAPSSEMEAITVKKLFLNTLIDAWVYCSGIRGGEESMDWKKIHYFLVKNGFDISEISGSPEKDSYVTLYFKTIKGTTQAVSFHFDRKGKNLIKPKISFPPDKEAFAFGFDEAIESMDSRILRFLETPAFDKALWISLQEKKKESPLEPDKNSKTSSFKALIGPVLAYAGTLGVLTLLFLYAPFGIYALGSVLLIALVTGLITMAETALISTTRDEKAVAYLQRESEKGNLSARKALDLVNKTYQKLPTITLTKNFVGVPGGILISDISNAFISRYIAGGILAQILDRIFSVVLSLIFSEQIPKDIASAEKKVFIVMAIAPVFPFFEKVLWPFIAFLNKLNRLTLQLVSVLFFLDRSSQKKETPYSKKIGKIFENGWLEGTLSDLEYHFLDGILSLDSTTMGELLSKRDWSYSLFSLSPEMKVSEAAKKLDQNFFSLIPLIDPYGVCHQVVSREEILLHVQKMTSLQRKLEFNRNRKEKLRERLEAAEAALKNSGDPQKTQRLIALFKKYIQAAEQNALDLSRQLTFMEFKNLLSLKEVPYVMISKDQPAGDILKLFLSENHPKMGLVIDSRHKRPVGVVTLEDMMEFLFQQEIFDETDLAKKGGNRGNISQKPMELISNAVTRKNRRLTAKLLELKKENQESSAPNHIYEIPRLEKELGFLTSVQIGFLFDLLWSDAFADRKIQPFIYSCNMEAYKSLAKWVEGKKEYADLFSLLKKSFKVIKLLNSGVPASHNFHQIYNDFYRLIRYAQIGNPQKDPRIDLLLKHPVLRKTAALLMLRDDHFLKNNLIQLKEISRIVEDAQSYRPQSFFKKLQPFLTFGMISVVIGGIIAAGFLISSQIGGFVILTLGLTFLSGLISGMEAAIFSVNREAVENLSYTGDPLALILKDILENRQKYIPTTVFFDTLIKIPGGILLKSASLPILGEIGSWLFSTIWFTIFVKVIPKFLGVSFSLPVAKIAAPVLKFLRGFFYPIVFSMQKLTLFFKAYLKALSFGKIDFMDSAPPKQSVEIYNQQRQEINRVFEAEKQKGLAGTDAESLEEKQKTIALLEKGLSFFGEVPRVLTVADVLNIKTDQKKDGKVSSQIFDLPADMTIEEANTIMPACPFSRILLYDRLATGKINYIGCVFKKDILQAYLAKDRKDSPLSSLVYTLVPRTSLLSPAKDSLKKFLAVGTAHLSIVEDAEGNPVAVLSLEDLMKYMLTPKNAEKNLKKKTIPAEIAAMISSYHPEKQAA